MPENDIQFKIFAQQVDKQACEIQAITSTLSTVIVNTSTAKEPNSDSVEVSTNSSIAMLATVPETLIGTPSMSTEPSLDDVVALITQLRTIPNYRAKPWDIARLNKTGRDLILPLITQHGYFSIDLDPYEYQLFCDQVEESVQLIADRTSHSKPDSTQMVVVSWTDGLTWVGIWWATPDATPKRPAR